VSNRAQASTALDTLVQAATVELFRAHGVAAAPLSRSISRGEDGRSGDLIGTIRFEGSTVNGSLALIISPETLELTRSAQLHSIEAIDWTRELVNQLMGRIKNRLLRYQVAVNAGLAAAGRRSSMTTKSGVPYYPFRTIRGEISVILTGSIDPTKFVYAAQDLGNEGDVVLF